MTAASLLLPGAVIPSAQERQITRRVNFNFYPDKALVELLKNSFGCARFVWNQTLGHVLVQARHIEDSKERHKLYKKLVHPVKGTYLGDFTPPKTADVSATE